MVRMLEDVRHCSSLLFDWLPWYGQPIKCRRWCLQQVITKSNYTWSTLIGSKLLRVWLACNTETYWLCLRHLSAAMAAKGWCNKNTAAGRSRSSTVRGTKGKTTSIITCHQGSNSESSMPSVLLPLRFNVPKQLQYRIFDELFCLR